MTLHLGVPAIVALVGLAATLLMPGKWSELGKVAFGCGLVVLLMNA